MQKNIDNLTEETKQYFKFNLNNEVPIEMVWDAYKVVQEEL